MRVVFLDPLEGVNRDVAFDLLGAHELIAAPSREELPEGWQTAEAVVWTQWPLDREMLDQMPHLKLVQRIGRFRARGDACAAIERGIPTSVLPHGTSARVAEHSVALIHGLYRGLAQSDAAVRAGINPAGLEPKAYVGGPPTLNWPRLPGLQSLYFKTIGILGFGEIGALIALLLRPFHVNVLYNKRTVLDAEQEQFFGVTYASLDEVLHNSDFVCNLIPVSDATRGMIGAREFGIMKPTAFFINTGRAATTDENALAQAIAEKRIAGAGLDVFELEPLPTDHLLAKLPQTLLTPHTAGGGGTPERVLNGLGGATDNYTLLGENLRRVEAGEPVLLPLGITDPKPGMS